MHVRAPSPDRGAALVRSGERRGERVEHVEMLLDACHAEHAPRLRPRCGDAEGAAVDLPLPRLEQGAECGRSRGTRRPRGRPRAGPARARGRRRRPPAARVRCAGRARPGAARRPCRRPRATPRGLGAAARPGSPDSRRSPRRFNHVASGRAHGRRRSPVPCFAHGSGRCLAPRTRENFPVASLLFPRELRPHLRAVYGYCRLVDILGDELEGDRLAALDELEREVDACYDGRADVAGDAASCSRRSASSRCRASRSSG